MGRGRSRAGQPRRHVHGERLAFRRQGVTVYWPCDERCSASHWSLMRPRLAALPRLRTRAPRRAMTTTTATTLASIMVSRRATDDEHALHRPLLGSGSWRHRSPTADNASLTTSAMGAPIQRMAMGIIRGMTTQPNTSPTHSRNRTPGVCRGSASCRCSEQHTVSSAMECPCRRRPTSTSLSSITHVIATGRAR